MIVAFKLAMARQAAARAAGIEIQPIGRVARHADIEEARRQEAPLRNRTGQRIRSRCRPWRSVAQPG
jgi:hypothetical protein